MHFALTDEQRALDSTVRDYLAERFDLSRVRQVVEDPAGDGHPPVLWTAAAEGGWLAATVPEEHDGLGLGLLDACVVATALGAGLAPGPWRDTVLAAEAVRLAGGDGQRADLLPGLAAGDTVGTVAVAGGGVPDPAAVEVREQGGRLSGRASAVPHAHVADVLVVVAGGADGGAALHLVDPGDVTVTRLDALDGTTRLCDVALDDAPARRLERSSGDAVAALLRAGAVLTAADLAGVARESLRRTVAYVGEREQFGRPVGSFQALQHHLADLHVAVTMAEHAVRYAAHAADAALHDAVLMASVAKAKATDAARDTTAAMIQYHGGIGYTWEHEAHLFFKRAKREEYEFGDAAWHREVVARLVVDRPGVDVADVGQEPALGESVQATGVSAAAAGA